MTVLPVGTDSPPLPSGGSIWRRWGRPRVAYRITQALGILPILVEVIRAGLSGWIPVQDAAPTVLRAKYAIGLPPTLVGMYTDAAQFIGHATYFPGAWQLYWLWLPIRVLGVSWGPLVAMGILNIGWLLLAGWFVRRRLGYASAAAVLVALAALNWVLSPGLLVTPVPMVMVLPAFACFCFGCWALASGDEGVLPLLALVANFLVLDHLVLTLLVPMIGFAAAGCWLFGEVWAARAEDPASRAQRRQRRRSASLWAAVVTLIMWLPVTIQQFANNPGNLTNLWHSGQARPGPVLSFGEAALKLLSLFVAPDFWFRSTRTASYLLSSAPRPSTLALVVAGVVLGGGGIGLAYVALRRRERAVLVGLFLSAVAFMSGAMSLARATGGTTLLTPQYAQSMWVVAVFVSFVFAFACVRLAPASLRSGGQPAIMVLALVIALLNLPHASITSGVTVATDTMIERARVMNHVVLSSVDGGGMVAVRNGNIGSYPYTSAAIVALDAAGVPFCIEDLPQFEPSPIPRCSGKVIRHEIRFSSGDEPVSVGEGWKLLQEFSPLSDDEREERNDMTRMLTAIFDTAIDTNSPITFAPELRKLIDTTPEYAPIRANVADDHLLNPPGGSFATATSRYEFARYIKMTNGVVQAHGEYPDPETVPPIMVPGVTWSQLVRWADLETRATNGTIKLWSRHHR